MEAAKWLARAGTATFQASFSTESGGYANGTNIEISVRAEGEMAVIEVLNYGKHIEDTVAIFSLGVTDRSSSENMGLGLYAAKIQIGGMDGNIVAENREGGVAFVITLPLSKGTQVT